MLGSGQTGAALAKQAKQLYPHLKVLYTSGLEDELELLHQRIVAMAEPLPGLHEHGSHRYVPHWL